MTDNGEARLDRAAIYRIIKANPGVLGKREISKKLKIGSDQKRELRMLLRDMEQSGEIIKENRRHYRVADALPSTMVVRIVSVDDDGWLTAEPVKWEEDTPRPQFEVREGKMAKGKKSPLGEGDRALVKLTQKDGTIRGNVMKRLAAAPKEETGLLQRNGKYWIIRPVGKGDRFDYAVTGEIPKEAESGWLVTFEPQRARRGGLKTAENLKVLGPADDPKAASTIALLEHDIPTVFPEEVVEEAKAVKLPSPAGREDLRDIPLITIDPEDARDFDDAIWAEPHGKGGWRVIVAIADVAYAVKPGSDLDREAEKRGNSVYLPDRVVPMLPEELSAGLCSLRPDEVRACMAVEMIFTKDGNKTKHRFIRGLMKSAARLTYKEAQEAFDSQPGNHSTPVSTTLDHVWQCYQSLKIAREARNPLHIDMPERRVEISPQGKVTDIKNKERFEANKLIEEFMVLSNVAAAEELDKHGMALIYRVHEPPSHEKLQAFSDYLPELGLKWSMGERATPARFNNLLDKMEESDMKETVNEAVLRTQSQAVYSPENKGHFGLSLHKYAHFTSPIRRYADLIVHRALIRACKLGDDGLTDREITRLKEIADHISDTERRAMAAERDATDRYIAAWLADREGAEFSGRITGVAKFGLFIRLADSGADGFIPAASLGDEYFEFDDRKRAMIGRDSGNLYKFGQTVRVRLKEVTPLTGGLLLEMLTPPMKGPKPKGGRKKNNKANRSFKRKSRKGKNKSKKK